MDSRQLQTQKLAQKQRSIQASRQMVYDIYGNVIGILEELESRECRSNASCGYPAKSDINIHGLKDQPTEELLDVLKMQFKALKIQLNVCREEIRTDLRAEFKHVTGEWVKARLNMPLKSTQQYVDYLFNIIDRKKGVVKPYFPEYIESEETEDDWSHIQPLMNGTEATMKLDESFEKYPMKKAALPYIRGVNTDVKELMDTVNPQARNESQTTIMVIDMCFSGDFQWFLYSNGDITLVNQKSSQQRMISRHETVEQLTNIFSGGHQVHGLNPIWALDRIGSVYFREGLGYSLGGTGWQNVQGIPNKVIKLDIQHSMTFALDIYGNKWGCTVSNDCFGKWEKYITPSTTKRV